jgi:hypothetical protein
LRRERKRNEHEPQEHAAGTSLTVPEVRDYYATLPEQERDEQAMDMILQTARVLPMKVSDRLRGRLAGLKAYLES